jgi:signal transduction histidine kinase/ActR/RegA family two-component response regulator
MTLRSHLIRLSILVVFPVALFGVGATLWIADRERDSFEEGARQRTLALLTAVDAELMGHALRLHVLAGSQNLHAGDLAGFRQEAARILPEQEHWRNILLTTPDGDPLISETTPSELPQFDPTVPAAPEGEVVIATPRLAGVLRVGNLETYGDERLFSVRQPVRIGTRDAVLTALIRPSSILGLLTPQGLPANWVGVVLDANQTIVARTLDHAGMLGRPAAESLRHALDGASEGWFQGTTIENLDVYTPFNRSASSGWTVALGIPAEYVENTLFTSMLVLVLGLLGAIFIAMISAGLYSKHIVAPIVSLASAAKALGTGDEVRPLQQSRFREVRAVSQALITSGEAIREREEKLRAADQAKNEFLAMLGHELRNPLASLAAAAQALGIKLLDAAAARESAGVISRQVDRMTRLVDDLLNVGRVVAGKVTLHLQPLDLGSATAQVIDNLRRASVFDGLVVETNVSPVWISGDEMRIEQVLSNLLENAGKYTPPDGRVDIRVFEEDGNAVFEVTDTGVGLAPDILPRVFDLFSQGERTMDRKVSGLGIGLTLAKQLTEMHDGTISAESGGTDRGARFTLTFPAIAAPDWKVDTLQRPVEVGANRRVLLIEDNDDARHPIAVVLSHYGYRILEAADGAEGIAIATELRPECAVIDIGLPKVDGYEVAARLRATPACANMLMIALSGYGGDESRAKAEAAGFDDYLVKPVSPDRLVELIETLAARDRSTADRETRARNSGDSSLI